MKSRQECWAKHIEGWRTSGLTARDSPSLAILEMAFGSQPAGTETDKQRIPASCRMHRIEPLAYIRDLLCLLPRWSQQRVLELAPVDWKQTLESPETQQALAANVFRRVVLDL